MLNCQSLTEELLKINQNIYMLIMNWIPLKIKYLILVALLKKADYNTKIGEINTKISTLDGKIDKSILETAKLLVTLSAGNILFDGWDGSQA